MIAPSQSREIIISENKLTKIVTMFEDIKYDIRNIKKSLSTCTNMSNIEDKLPEETEALIPALLLERLTAFNEYFKQKCIFDRYQKYLRRFGGTSQADHTRRILTRIIHNEFAQTLNWAGRGDKTSFKTFDAVCELILKSTCTTQESSYKVTEDTIKSWLRYAIDQDGGRNRRREIQNNYNIEEEEFDNDNN